MKETRIHDAASRGDRGGDEEADPEELGLPDPYGPRKACPVIFYGETHLLRLPWSVLSKGEISTTRQIQYASPDGKLRWRVTAGRRGMPGPFEKSVFRAWEWMALEFSACKGRPLVNPVQFHPKEVCERLRLREREANFQAVEEAMRRLSEVEIFDAGFVVPPPGRRLRLVSGIAWHRPERAERRSLHARHSVFFDGLYARSVDAGRVRPLNWELWVSLERPAAQRLVEILDQEFSSREERPLQMDYFELCRLLPLKSHGRLNGGATLLDEAHEELVAHQYLEKSEWDLTGPLPRILYTPGAAYYAMEERLRPSGKLRALLAAPGEGVLGLWNALLSPPPGHNGRH